MPTDLPQDPPKDPPEAAKEEPEPVPAEPASPAKEWGLAVILMVVFATICFMFMSYLRG